MSEIKRDTEMFYSKTSASPATVLFSNSMQGQQNFAVNDGSKRDIDGRYVTSERKPIERDNNQHGI